MSPVTLRHHRCPPQAHKMRLKESARWQSLPLSKAGAQNCHQHQRQQAATATPRIDIHERMITVSTAAAENSPADQAASSRPLETEEHHHEQPDKRENRAPLINRDRISRPTGIGFPQVAQGYPPLCQKWRQQKASRSRHAGECGRDPAGAKTATKTTMENTSKPKTATAILAEIIQNSENRPRVAASWSGEQTVCV